MTQDEVTRGAGSPAPRRVDDPALAAWRTLLEVHSLITGRLGAELQEQTGLPLSFYDVLLHLSEAPEHRLRMQELAERVLLSRSGLTRLIDRMQREGLVARAACKDDKRGTFAELTPEGMARLRAAAPVHLAGIEREFSTHLDREEALLLRRLLSRMLA